MSKRVVFMMVPAMLVLVMGCQSEAEAMKLVCESPNQVDKELPPAERGRALAAYIEKNVKNDEVLRLLTGEEPRMDKAKKLEVFASKAGIEECALAKLWGMPPLPPPPPAPSMSAIPLPPPSGSAPVLLEQVEVQGALPIAVIEKVIQAAGPSLRTCYESGIKRDKKLEGRVRVRFEIGKDGKVTKAADADSVMPDAKVTECIIENFKKLEFPKPEKGTVTVVYPITLRQGT